MYNVSDIQSFEYIDRNHDSKIVQIGMFEKIIKRDQIKIGDRFICPQSKNYKNGIVDANTMKPILLFVKKISDFHITFSDYENKGGNPAIAWDLCYILKNE